MPGFKFGRADGSHATVVGAGTAQSGAASIVEHTNYLTSETGQTAFILPANHPVGSAIVCRVGTVAALIYPPVGGKINNGSANASVSVTALKTVALFPIEGTSGLDWMAVGAI
jgi:hypothetical protein